MRSLPLSPVPVLPDGIEIPDVAALQDGVFTRTQAREQGWPDHRTRRLVKQGLWVPLTPVALRHREVEAGPWQLARAVQLTTNLVVSHHTAGLLWQYTVPCRLRATGRTQRVPAPVFATRLDLADDEWVEVRGVRVTTPLRTLTDLMCDLALHDGVALLTDGFRRGLMTADDVREATGRAFGRYGVTGARVLERTCRREPHSVLEWRYHGLVDSLGPGWTFNVDIYDDQGFVARVDALHAASGTIVELDSRRFHDEDQFQSDRSRDQRLAALGYVVVPLTWDDVERRPIDVVERIRRTVSIRMRGRQRGLTPAAPPLGSPPFGSPPRPAV